VTVPNVSVNDTSTAVMTVDRVPLMTSTYAVAEFGDRYVLVPASPASTKASPDVALAQTLSATGHRAASSEFAAWIVSPPESWRTASVTWVEELAAARRLAARVIVMTSSYDVFVARNDPVGLPRIAVAP
jgi:hypothetical protein